MGVYHITYTPKLKEVCLYLKAECNFSCHGCITDFHPLDCHLDNEEAMQTKNRMLNINEVVLYLKPLSFEKVIFLGKEPTEDEDFLSLAKILKENFSTYNILLTNGYKFVEESTIDEVCISIKAISRRIFKNFTGKDNPRRVLKNFKRYAGISGLKVRAESILIPGYIDKDEIEKIAHFIGSIDSSIPYRIDAYIPYSRNDIFRRPAKSRMEEARIVAQRYLQNVSILHYGIKTKYKVNRIY